MSSHKASSVSKSLFFFAFALLTGCAPSISVTIDSICSDHARLKKKFVLIPEDSNIADLQYQEYARYIESTLLDIGFNKALDFEDANVVILLAYGISDPKTYTYTYNVPVYGQTGVNTSSTGFVNCYNNGATYSGNTYSTPTYGVIGSQEKVGVGIAYVRHFSLVAADLEEYKNSEKINELWTTKVVSVGPSGDLRAIFPVLVTAAKDYIASNTGKKISISISTDDKRVAKLLNNDALN